MPSSLRPVKAWSMFEVFALFLSPLLHHDLITQLDALVTDINCGACDQLFNFFLTFATERTTVISGSRTFLCHSVLQLCWDVPSNRFIDFYFLSFLSLSLSLCASILFVITLSMRPYAFASSPVMKLSRSVSLRTVSLG